MLTNFATALFRETLFHDPLEDMFIEDDFNLPWIQSDDEPEDEEIIVIKKVPKKSQWKRRKLLKQLQSRKKQKKQENRIVPRIDSHNAIGMLNNEETDFGITKIVNDKEKYQMVAAVPQDIQNIRVTVDETPEKEKYLTIEASDSKEKRDGNSYFKSSVSFKRQVLVPNDVKEKDLKFTIKRGKLLIDIPKSQTHESKDQEIEKQTPAQLDEKRSTEENNQTEQSKSQDKESEPIEIKIK
jgi:HSP20 family molecular chaperone IbpA